MMRLDDFAKIDLRIANDLMQRAIAFGPGRARANSSSQTIVADSIDIRMPDQRLSELFAIRGAAAEGRPDSLKFITDTTDWLSGDTIIARFDTVPSRDTANSVQLKTLIAHGGARSYYHLAPRDTSLREAAINYVRGRQMRIYTGAERIVGMEGAKIGSRTENREPRINTTPHSNI